MRYHLAQINIARLVAPIDDPRIAGFVAQLGPINALAESSSGFVWRLQSESGNATDVPYNDDPFVIVNMSVWESIEALRDFAYRSQHLEVFKDRLTKRQEVLRWYITELEPLGCAFQSDGSLGVPAFVSVALPSQRHREELRMKLDEVEVGWRAYFNPPIHGHPAFAELQRAGDLAVTDDLCGRIISLPLDDWLTQADVGRIVSAVGCVVGH